MNKEIQKELERIIEDTNYSQKGHFSAASIYNYIHFLLGIVASVLSFVAVTILLSNPTKLTTATYLALLAGVITTVSTFIDPDKKHREHFLMGTDFKEPSVVPNLDIIVRGRRCGTA